MEIVFVANWGVTRAAGSNVKNSRILDQLSLFCASLSRDTQVKVNHVTVEEGHLAPPASLKL